MHDLKKIRKDFETFKKLLDKRSIDIDLNKLKELREEKLQKKGQMMI